MGLLDKIKKIIQLSVKINATNTSKKYKYTINKSKHINYKELSSKEKGKQCESVVHTILNQLPEKDYYVLKNLLLKDIETLKTVQIDHIVISKYGIFVIETKNYSGYIYGDKKRVNWTQVLNKNSKFSFKNPMHQNYGHIKFLEKLTNIDVSNFISIVVFSEKTNISNLKEISNVVNTSKLKSKILSYNEIKIANIDTLHEIKVKILTSNINSRESEKTHIDDIKLEQYKNRAYEKNNICPLCKSPLVKRNGKYGTFIGCSNYPKCKFTKK